MRILDKHIQLRELDAAEWSTDQHAVFKDLLLQLERAYAPYSRFPVAASLLLANGEMLGGSNQENVAFPSGLCAERVALFHYGHVLSDQPIRAIGITVERSSGAYAFPCGACLQVMAEFQRRQDEPFAIWMYDRAELRLLEADGLNQLLPFAFDEEGLR